MSRKRPASVVTCNDEGSSWVSAAVHKDAVTSAFAYSRNEARALGSVAALLTVVDEPA
jgi:hypothetical protein